MRQSNIEFQKQRDNAYGAIIAYIDTRIEALKPAIVTSFQEISVDTESYQREAWSLLRRGVVHLKEGAPEGQPGSFTEALSRASLRSSSLAATMAVKRPEFKQTLFAAPYTTGAEAAIFLCANLTEAVKSDINISTDIIFQKIKLEPPLAAFGIMPAIDDKNLSGIFQSVQTMHAVAENTTGPSPKVKPGDLRALTMNMTVSLDMLAQQYHVVCADFGQVLLNLEARNPSPSRPSGPSFDL